MLHLCATEADALTDIAPCELIPRRFSCVKAPTDCNALSLRLVDAGSGLQKAKRKTKHHESGGGVLAKRRKSNVKFDEFLVGLFEERPIWAKYALQMRCDKAGMGGNESRFGRTLRSMADFQKYVRFFGYSYTHLVSSLAWCLSRSGPWSGAWVKHGFKPRARVKSAMYQVIFCARS